MSDARTRAETKATSTARDGLVAGSPAGAKRTAAGDRGALVRRAWPLVSMPVAVLLWWPVGFVGRAEWMHLPLTQTTGGVAPVSGGVLFLGSLVAAAVVSALVSSPWPRFGIAAGLTVVAWVLTDRDLDFAAGERVVLAALAGIGMLLGLAVGARAARGAVPVATFLALVSGLSPATWSRGVVLSVAVALPFWVATSDRVAPTILAVVRVVLTWLVAVVVSISLWAGFGALKVGALADPAAAAPVVGRAFVDNVRDNGLEIARTAPQVYTGWIWLAVVLAVAFVVVATALKRRRARNVVTDAGSSKAR